MLTNTLGKLKADDYLQELANQSREGWLRSLIARILSSRTLPDKSFLDIIYQQFLIEYKLRDKDPERPASSSETIPSAAAIGFILHSLHHESGVNALEQGATIPFHPKLTVVYGKNGSGKSGFVRILKRVAGSKTQEEVWQNIHERKTQNRCKARIHYAVGAVKNVLPWNGASKISPFDQLSIFDGKCVPVYLNKRLGFSYQPYGLELFHFLSGAFQELQQRLANDIRNTENGNPSIDYLFNKETSIGKFVGTITAATKPEDLKLLPAWNAKAQKALTDNMKKRNGLQNVDQRIEVLQTRQEKLEALETALTQVQSDLSAQQIKAYFGLISKFNELKKKQAVKKGKTLKDYDIAEMESDEWHKFIEAGEDYIRVAGYNEYPRNNGHCIYCQQKLSKEAQKLVQLYRELFEQVETSDLENAEAELDDALGKIEGSSFADDLRYTKEVFANILQKRTTASAFGVLTGADNLAQRLAASLKNRKPQKLRPLKTGGIIASIRKVRAKLEMEVNALEEARRDIRRKSAELDRAIAELQDAQKLAKNRLQVESYIVTERWIAQATLLLASKLNTKPVTDLGTKASKELISDSFKHRFRDEAANLNAPIVDLEFHGEYGSQMRAKNMDGLDGIDRFLSEGEQKAVALADFFAELSMQHEHAPVIFDDPATSFDYDRKEKIANRIVSESESRQIVVFTHDLVFASYLHDRVESADGKIDSAKAAFHDLQSEAKRVGVVTENYYPGSVKFDAFIQKVEAKTLALEPLTGEAKTEGISNVYGLLRRAVEKAVEERIFGGVMTRWKDQIQMHQAPRASLSREKLDKAKRLHEEFSRYIVAHSQSDEMVQHTAPDIARLKTDIQQVKELAVR